LLDFGREIIIILLLLFLINETKIKELRALFIVGLLIHLYKIYENYDKIKDFTLKNGNLSIITFIFLIFSLYLFIKGNQWLFLILFVLFRIIMNKMANYERISPKIDNSYNLSAAIILLIMYFSYQKYNYRSIFLMDAINHVLLFMKL
jgi:hypothetical protein